MSNSVSSRHTPDPLHPPSPLPIGVQQQRVNAESLLLEAVKQVKVSDLEDDILELPEDDPTGTNNQ